MKKAKLFAGITLASGLVAVSTSYITARVLVDTAMNRKIPKIMRNSGRKIAGFDKNIEFSNMCNVAAEKLKNTEHEVIITKNSEGKKLVGHYFPAKNPKRMIIAFHGWRSAWYSDFCLITDFWKNNNCSVIFVEQQGQNNSEGEYMGFGLIERYDCLAWANYVTERFGKLMPIYLTGVSMGATTVLMSAGLNLPENVHGIMADCGFTSPKAIWKHVANNNLHISYTIRGMFVDYIMKRKISQVSNSYSTINALKNSLTPVLFIHGTDDHFVPVEMTYENYKACTAPKKLLIVPGADHVMSYYTDRPEYEKAVLEFWNEFDSYNSKLIAE